MVLTFINRILGTLKIDVGIFEEIKNDNSLIFQGAVVALLAAIINALIFKKYFPLMAATHDFPILIIIFTWLFLNWYFLSHLINFIGFKMFPEGEAKNKYRSLLSGVGYSYSPELIKFLILFYPGLIKAISFGTFVWVIACQVVATKVIFNFKSSWKSLGVVVLSYVFQILSVLVFVMLIHYFSK